jgi:ADP-ribose pyrophosphatase YjhB (NUDIX family)
MTPRQFLSDQSPLETEDAAAAIIIVRNSGYLLQLRDDIPGIFYPGHWCCFGGAIHPGEMARDAVRPELAEELEFAVAHCHDFIRLDFDLAGVNGKKIYRTYYDPHITTDEARNSSCTRARTPKCCRQPRSLMAGRWPPTTHSRSGFTLRAHGCVRMGAIDPSCVFGRTGRGLHGGPLEGTTGTGELLRPRGSKSCRYCP